MTRNAILFFCGKSRIHTYRRKKFFEVLSLEDLVSKRL